MKPPELHARFGPFEVTSADGRLRRDGEVVPLQELPFRVLLELVRADGAVVTREGLCRALWADTVVEYEAGLNTAVRKLRDALGDDPAAPAFVETVPRRGYRLRVSVDHVEPSTAAALRPVEGPLATAVGPSAAAVSPGRAIWRWMLAGAGVALVSVLVHRTTGTPPATRILVLPVESASDPLDRARMFGLTDQLIAHLARLDPARLAVLGPVTARAVGRSGASRSVGRDLAVTHILSARLAEGRLAVSLARTEDDAVVWSEILNHPPGDAWPETSARWTTLVARGLLQAFGLDASDKDIVRAATLDTRAFDEYLRGSSAWARFDGDGFAASVAAFQAAVTIDPGFADAFVGLAEARAMQALFQTAPATKSLEASIAAAREALTLAPDDARGSAALALAQLYSGANAADVARHFERALALDGGRALTHQWAAGYFSASGDGERAIEHATHARVLDPLSPGVNSDLCWYHYFARDYPGAAAQAARAFAAFGRPNVLLCGQLASWKAGDEPKERELQLLRLTKRGQSADARALSEAFELGGMTGVRTADLLRLGRSTDPMDGYQLVVAAAAVGDTALAVATLERLVPDRPPWLVFLEVDPAFDGLRSLAAFRRLVASQSQ